MPWTADQVRRHKAAAKAVADIHHSTEAAVDNFCDSIETLLTAIAQRPMSDEQTERLARILQGGERDLLDRVSGSTDRKPSAAAAPDRAA